ncbi:MAG: GGDEF domain-containing protein, partial [Deltaproteobacteria bacterium]|nr:GGDEF domain-containing protein [Deltaproteobacteria bacterium]
DRELLASSPVWSADPKGLYAAFRAESDRLRFPIGKGLAGSALRDRRPVLMDSLEDNPNFPRKGVAKACGLRWGLAAPVLVGDEVAAVVEFFGSDAATFDRPHIDLVSHVGVQLGRVVDRARARVALEQAAETLREQSVLDELTGLYNRRGFLTLAEERRASARRAGQRAFLLFADLDGMKRINDELGHDAGDVALRETADLLRRTLRKADIVARLGGDEFVALVCETGKFDEGALLRRLELELERLNREKRLPFVLSASFGLAQPEGPDETLAAMIKRADEEMYKAKTARKQARG